MLSLKNKGLHFTKEGVSLIYKILNQMNNNRLSTSSNKSEVVSRELLQLEIFVKKLLSAPSNLVVEEGGRIFIKSMNKYYSSRSSIEVELQMEDGSVLEWFKSLVACAKFLGVSPIKVSNILTKKSTVTFNNMPLCIVRKTSNT